MQSRQIFTLSVFFLFSIGAFADVVALFKEADAIRKEIMDESDRASRDFANVVLVSKINNKSLDPLAIQKLHEKRNQWFSSKEEVLNAVMRLLQTHIPPPKYALVIPAIRDFLNEHRNSFSEMQTMAKDCTVEEAAKWKKDLDSKL